MEVMCTLTFSNLVCRGLRLASVHILKQHEVPWGNFKSVVTKFLDSY